MVEFIINIKPFQKRGVYSISNNIDDRVYIGRTNNFYRRAYQHREKILKGGGNSKIKAFIEENPDACFIFNVILQTDDIKSKEEEFIKKYKAVECGFNIVHNDEEIKELFIKNQNVKRVFPKKKEKHYLVSEFEHLGLERGYIRKKGALFYNPRKARQILENCTIKEEKKKIIKPKQKIKTKPKKKKKSKKYDWASVGFDVVLPIFQRGFGQNETSNNG